MPPSPLLRRSPARELRTESTHKRGRSFESGLMIKAKDDDLALFNEMQNRERDNFLLHTSDDFDDSLTKLRYFSDFKLGINIPALGESSDLLNADNEKNDYDWLLTPPDTPLFPSLDHDEPQPVNLSRGRARSQAISIARPSLSEMTPRTSRSSASPHRLSPTPRSSYNAFQSRARPSSVPRSSPPPVLRPSTPSQRHSTPPAKAATPATRSSTPTMRRMSSGSSTSSFSSGRREASPVKPNRGNSASPKLHGWQPELAGFPTDAPPNLRTSLSDRATSRVRGFSPASSTSSGRNSSSTFGRKSTSPSSRNARLSHSLERDSVTSCTRVSVASSGDDDADSMQSVNVGVTENSAVRKYGAFANSRPMALPKKSSKSPSANSTLKKSFDSAVRQMDNRKAPQNMFRPLLSSVPATTFYVGKPNSMHRAMFSRNLSLTTSSNASSEQGMSFAPDMEYNDHDQNDLAGEWGKTKGPPIDEEVFTFDKLDEVSDSNNYDTHTKNVSGDETKLSLKVNNEITYQVLENNAGNTDHALNTLDSSQSGCVDEDYEINCKDTLGTCCQCGKQFLIITEDQLHDVCEECAAIDGLLTSEELKTTLMSLENKNTLGSEITLPIVSPKLSVSKINGVESTQNESECEQRVDFSSDSNSIKLDITTKKVHLYKDNIDFLDKESTSEFGCGCKSQQLEPTAVQALVADSPEGTGISVLLMQKSGSCKWPIVHGRTFSATNIFCSEPSYARDNVSTMKRSFSKGSSSPSSSVDLTSSRQMDVCMMRQPGIRKVEMENVRSNYHVLTRSTDARLETSANIMVPLVHEKGETEENSFVNPRTLGNDIPMKEKKMGSEKHNLNQSATTSTLECSSLDNTIIEDDRFVCSRTSDESSNLQSSQQLSTKLYNHSVSNPESGNHLSHEHQNIEKVVLDAEQLVKTSDCSFKMDNLVLDSAQCQDDISEEHQEDHICYEVFINESSIPAQVPDDMEDFREACTSAAFVGDNMVTPSENKNMLVTTEETTVSEHFVDEETSTMVEPPKRLVQRNITLEEATDTILFCSSIVHDISYKAVAIGMEKELALPEAPRPTVTILGKSVSNQKDLRNISIKRVQNSKKFKRKRPEIDIKVSNMNLEDSTKDPEPAHTNTKVLNTVDNTKPPKLESKCNCSVM